MVYYVRIADREETAQNFLTAFQNIGDDRGIIVLNPISSGKIFLLPQCFSRDKKGHINMKKEKEFQEDFSSCIQ